MGFGTSARKLDLRSYTYVYVLFLSLRLALATDSTALGDVLHESHSAFASSCCSLGSFELHGVVGRWC